MYSEKRKVMFSDVREDETMDISKITDYFQDCGTNHTESVGLSIDKLTEMGLAWIVVSWQIDVIRAPRLGETVEVATWPYKGAGRLYAYRNFTITDSTGEIIVKANSFWVMLDLRRMTITGISEEVASYYTVSDKLDMVYKPRKIQNGTSDFAAEPFTVPRAYIDRNSHMNNAWYVRAALEYLPEDFTVGEMRAEFRNSAKKGDIIYPKTETGEGRIVVYLNDEAGNPYSVIELTNKGTE
ncbi:MAG: acyl-[acyl-carrier-protein] thioesterase [Lachnospiraceae bacterium]|nr:acyl-[acyl-carrier-protein] thioesterase [Lachnospiraceae bacterium]